MAQAPTERKYDLVVFGASGYTGRLTCEQVLTNTPSSLKWAIAGRSPNKLELLAVEYNRRFPDRVPPGMSAKQSYYKIFDSNECAYRRYIHCGCRERGFSGEACEGHPLPDINCWAVPQIRDTGTGSLLVERDTLC